mgnify:CR=1 FL=1
MLNVLNEPRMLVRCGVVVLGCGMKVLNAFTQFVVLVSLPLLLGGCGGDDVPVTSSLSDLGSPEQQSQ